MKILILGHSGFVGKNVVNVLSDSKYLLFLESKCTGLDLTNLDLVTSKFKEIEPDIIVNLAAVVGSLNYVTEKAAEVVDQNMRILLNIYHAIVANKLKTIVINPIANCGFPGNLEIYSEEDFWNGEIHKSVLSFGSTRRMIDVISRCYRMQYAIKSINYFVPNMYGPFESTDPNKAHALDALVSKFVKAKKENASCVEVWGDGSPIREWLYVEDFARVIKLTIDNIEKINHLTPINIGQNFGLSIKDLVGIIVDNTGFNNDIDWKTDMPNGAPRKVMSDNRFKKLFPDFKFTSFNEGLVKTIKYYNQEYPY